MGYQVILSRRAKADLDEIEAHVKRDDPTAAERLVRGLIDDAFALVELPRRGRPFRRNGRVRRIVHGKYLIVYRINETERTVEVARFWHGARGRPKL
jgi:toxin ParE1/3/4